MLEKTFKFSNAVKLIRDEQNKRFCLLNLNLRHQNQYLVFGPEQEYLLDYFVGTTVKDLHLKTKISIKEIEAITEDFKKNLFFLPVKFTDDLFPKRNQKEKDNYLLRLRKILNRDLKDYYKRRNITWSQYAPPPFAHNIEITMDLTNDCNLACKYCYAMANLKYDKRAGSDLYMSEVTMKTSIDRIIEYLKRKYGGGSLGITYFGGQPSLKGKARDLLFRTIEYANKKALEERVYIHTGIVDNGTQIDDELMGFLKKYKVAVSISFDLPLDVQDIHRPLRNGDKTSVLVENSLKSLIKNNFRFGIRATLSGLNQDKILKSVDYLKTMGIRSAAFIPMEKAFSSANNCNLPPINSEILYNEYIKAYEYTKQLYYNEGYLFHLAPITNMISKIMSGGLIRGCGMGNDYYSINTNGDIHTCQRVRTKEFLVCNIFDKNIFDKLENISLTKKANTIYTPFLKRNKTCLDYNSCSFCNEKQITSCADCEILLFCAGGCVATAWDQYGCRNRGGTNLCDSGLQGENKCFYTKKLMKRLFWEFIDLDKEEDKMFKYFASIAGIKKEFWETVC